MYLSKEEVCLLDETMKYFEVAFRGYIADKLISTYDTMDKYRAAVSNKKDSFSGESVILSAKIVALLENLAKESTVKKIYTLLSEAKYNCENRVVVDVKTDKKDVFLVVSEIISLTYIFGADIFSDMLLKFNSREEYMYLVEEYRIVRNNVAHPEASIGSNFYYEIYRLISTLTEYIDDKYFWYASKVDLKKKMDVLTISINNSLRVVNNLSMLPKQKSKFVCRTKEIKTLKTYLSGNEMGMGRMHYILISGFGGMGKTALITETILQLIRDYNNQNLRDCCWFDFILFFTAKEEVLDISAGGNVIETYKLKSQISSLEDIKFELNKFLGTNDLLSIDKRGLVVIDNFETLPDTEKKRINDFIIYEAKPEVQFVITSRNDESIDTNYQLHLKAFEENDGVEFIDRYMEENNTLICISEEEKRKLVSLCKGNTIVLVLSINRISKGIALAVIEKELSTISSETINNIVNFMAKNSFDEIYKQYSSSSCEIDRILQILVLYDDPIDKYSLKVLSDTGLDFVDRVVRSLTSGLILEQQREEIQINEYAKTYLLIKFKPNRIEFLKKQELISEYKRRLAMKKNNLLECRMRNPQVDDLLSDWQPNNLIDELAILEAFEAYNYFGVASIKYGKIKKCYNLEKITEYFERIETTSTHPYIYAQKARILLPLLRMKRFDKEPIRECLEDSFEKTIISIETQYTNIKGTLSYASVLRELGRFYLENKEKPDYMRAANYSEKARDIYLEVNPEDRYYYYTLRNIAIAYIGSYEQTKDSMYLAEAKRLLLEIIKTTDPKLEKVRVEAGKEILKCR